MSTPRPAAWRSTTSSSRYTESRASSSRGTSECPRAPSAAGCRHRFGDTPPSGRARDVASTLVDLLRDHGYVKASVRPRRQSSSTIPNRTTLVFDVTAGPLARIRNVVIEGTPLDAKDRVLALVGATSGRPYDRADIRQRLEDYVTKMRRRGYYQASATDNSRRSPDDGRRSIWC